MREDEKSVNQCYAAEAPIAMTNQQPRKAPKVPLFVIKMRHHEEYWTCSSEHGSGWNSRPKQSFSPSELATQVGLLAREFWCDITIIQLAVS